jgi:hypothetical protein
MMYVEWNSKQSSTGLFIINDLGDKKSSVSSKLLQIQTGALESSKGTKVSLAIITASGSLITIKGRWTKAYQRLR